MRITVVRETFLKSASLVAQAINPRSNLPVLGNFLLTAQRGFLEITATDLETTITNKIPVKVEEDGKVTTPAKILIDFCQAAGGEQTNLIDEKDSLLVKAGKAEASLPTISSAEFPSVAEFETGVSLEIDKAWLLEGIAAVSFSASPEEGRPVLTGVLLSASGDRLDLVATDGYRLAKKELKVKGTLEAIVSARALQEGAKALTEQDDDMAEISINKEKNQARLKTRDLTIISRLLEGSYPNYEQIIPASFVAEVTTNTKELAEAIKLASLFAREVGNVVRLEVADRTINVSASTAQVGEAKTVVAAALAGEGLKIAFNARFLSECLAAIKSKETHISFSGASSAVLLRGTEDTSLMYVVMPVRIQS